MYRFFVSSSLRECFCASQLLLHSEEILSWWLGVQILEDMLRYFPRIDRSQVTIKQIDSHDHILSAFDRTIAEYATEHFRRSGIDLVLACRVRRILLVLSIAMQ